MEEKIRNLLKTLEEKNYVLSSDELKHEIASHLFDFSDREYDIPNNKLLEVFDNRNITHPDIFKAVILIKELFSSDEKRWRDYEVETTDNGFMIIYWPSPKSYHSVNVKYCPIKDVFYFEELASEIKLSELIEYITKYSSKLYI